MPYLLVVAPLELSILNFASCFFYLACFSPQITYFYNLRQFQQFRENLKTKPLSQTNILHLTLPFSPSDLFLCISHSTIIRDSSGLADKIIELYLVWQVLILSHVTISAINLPGANRVVLLT